MILIFYLLQAAQSLSNLLEYVRPPAVSPPPVLQPPHLLGLDSAATSVEGPPPRPRSRRSMEVNEAVALGFNRCPASLPVPPPPPPHAAPPLPTSTTAPPVPAVRSSQLKREIDLSKVRNCNKKTIHSDEMVGTKFASFFKLQIWSV